MSTKFRSVRMSPLAGSHNGSGHLDFSEQVCESSSVPITAQPLRFSMVGGPFQVLLLEDVSDDFQSKIRPTYYTVAFRANIADFKTVNLFFHPSPGNAGMTDQSYTGLGGKWGGLFRYGQYFGVQFAGAKANIVFVMPMIPNALYGTLGRLKLDWKDVLNGVLAAAQRAKSGEEPEKEIPAGHLVKSNALENVILSGFSRGRAPMTTMRGAPGLSALLRGIWDFDGVGGAAVHAIPDGKAFAYDQGAGSFGFHVPRPRWKDFPGYTSTMAVHGHIPQRLAFHAALNSGFAD